MSSIALALSAAVAAAVLFACLPAAWAGRIWLALTVFIGSWHLSGKSNDTGLALTSGHLTGWMGLIVISGLLGGLAGLAIRSAKPGAVADVVKMDRTSAILAFISVLPLGVWLISAASLALAGSAHPYAWHGVIVLATLGLGGFAWRRLRPGSAGAVGSPRLRPPLRGLALGLTVSCLWATVDSLRLESHLLTNVNDWYKQTDMPKCLGTGPTGRAITDQRPLTTLTAERPVALRVAEEGPFEAMTWTFRENTFVGTNPPPPLPSCQPADGPLLPG